MSDRVSQLLDALPSAGLPLELVGWLRDGFTAWQAGADLHSALSLNGPDVDRRDDLLRIVILLSPGESITAQCAYTIACLDGRQHHHRQDMQNIVRSLQLVGCPRSIKQLKRIVEGRRQDGWHVREADINRDLCPPPALRFNREKSTTAKEST